MTFYSPSTNRLWDRTLQAFSKKTEFPYSKRKKHTFNPQLFVLLSNLLKGITVAVLLRLRWKDICTFSIKRKRLYCLRAYVNKICLPANLFTLLFGSFGWDYFSTGCSDFMKSWKSLHPAGKQIPVKPQSVIFFKLCFVVWLNKDRR